MTPGEKAHAAWKAAMDALGDAVPTWEEVSLYPQEVAAWEAAAEAVANDLIPPAPVMPDGPSVVLAGCGGRR